MTDVCEMLGIKYPIFCGAMGGISRPELVAAVSNAGGMGILMTAGMKDEEKIRQAVQKTRELTDKYGDPNKLDFIYSELAFGQLFFVAYS
ncbi:nitronate monooxygenase, partial [Aerococcus urinae]|uniref:nitronate monooxygenase n=1 Tax=Aerococcus urinae TaxID=1376 RepID=UPI00254C8FBC